MNSKTLIALFAVLNLTGCIIVDRGGGGTVPPPPPPPKPGNITFTWSFAGAACADVPQVKSVVIDIPGEKLQNNGIYPCVANNYPGIELHDFVGGNYSFNIEAIGYGNERLYVGSGTFTVNGNVRVTIDLTPVGGPNSYAYLSWYFPPNSAAQSPNCEQAGITSVDVSIDGANFVRYGCAGGFTPPGVQSPFVKAGSHTIEIIALSSTNYVLYRYAGTLTTSGGAPVAADYGLGWAVGGSAIRWQLTNGSVGQNCSQAGIQNMNVNFQDTAGNMVYGTAGDSQLCDAAPIVYSFLKPGTYKVFIRGTGPGGTYLSNATVPPTVTVNAGEFLTTAQATTVQLFKVQ
jgi:hypothetical protein